MSFCYFHIKIAYAEEEIIKNGGFETGDLSNWTYDGRTSVTGDTFHSGSYSAHLKANSTLPDFAWIEQDFSSMNKSEMTSFGFWYKGTGESGCDPLCCWLILDGEEDLYIENSPIGDWTYEDLVDDIPENRNVTSITFSIEYYIHLVECEYWIDDVSLITGEPQKYYFNFDFYDLDSEDVELYVDWALWNSTHDINYTEGETSLHSGTYYLKTSKYGHLINTTTLDTDTYGNSTIDINLNMKRHQSCPNGFIVSNDTISSITVHAETPQLLNFTMEGTPPDQHGVGVAKNASYILEDGVNMTGWVYLQSPSHIYWDQPDEDETLIDSYDVEVPNEGYLPEKHPSSNLGTSAVGQTIKPNLTYRLTSIKFSLRKSTGILNGTLKAYVYAHTGTFGSNGMPIGEVLAESTNNVDMMNDLTTTYALYEFDFDGSFIMTKDIPYSLAIYSLDGNMTAEVYPKIARFNEGTHEGNGFRFRNSAWAVYDTIDHVFYAYGQPIKRIFTFVFPSTTDPVVGPHTPMNNRVKVTVRLNGEWVKGCNVTVEGGPDNRTEWGLTDVFGSVKFNLKTGSYEIVASYEQHRKVKPVYVSTHMTIGIDLTEEDIIRPDVLPDALEDFLAWVKLPELDLTTETLLVFILPLIVLVIYAVKKASEGPKRKWKYSYLK